MSLILKVAILSSVFTMTSCVYDITTVCETDVEFLNNDTRKYQSSPTTPNSGYYYFDQVRLNPLEKTCEDSVRYVNNRDDPRGPWGDVLIQKLSWFSSVEILQKGQKGRIKIKYFAHKWGAAGHSKVYLIKVYEN